MTPPDQVAARINTWRQVLAERRTISALDDLSVAAAQTIDLTSAHPSGMAQLFAGRRTQLSNLIRQPSALHTARRRAAALLALTSRADTVVTPALVIGVARVGGQTMPVLLRDVKLTETGSDVVAQLEPGLRVNPSLERFIQQARADAGAGTAPLDLPDAFGEHGFDPRGPLDAVRDALASTGATVSEQLLIAGFNDPSCDVIADLDASDLEHNEIARALAGDADIQADFDTDLPEPPEGDRDATTERGVGDLGSTERHVLDLIGAGRNLFVSAPVGADTEALVAAIAADAAASGRTVTLAWSARSQGEAHVNRLAQLGLDDLLLDCGPGTSWRSDHARRLFGALNPVPVPYDADRAHRVQLALTKRREQLQDFVAALHARRPEWDASAYDALVALTKLVGKSEGPTTTVRLSLEAALGLTGDRRAQAGAELTRAALLGAFSSRRAATPWAGATLTTAEATTKAFDAAARVVTSGMSTLQEHAETLAAQTGLTAATTPAELGAQLTLLAGVRTTLDTFQPLVFEHSMTDYITATADPAWRKEHAITMGAGQRRRLAKSAADMARPGRLVADLHAALVGVANQQRAWKAAGGEDTWPHVPEGLPAAERDYATVSSDLELLAEVLGPQIVEQPFDDIEIQVSRLHADEDAIANLPECNSLLGILRRRGLDELLTDLSERDVPAHRVADELSLAWWTTALESIAAEDMALGYDAAALATLVSQFAELDRYHVASRAGAVRADVAAEVAGVVADPASGAQVLFDDLAGEGLASLRQAYQRHPVARRLRPVLSTSLAGITAVLPARRTEDLIVVDVRGEVDEAELAPAVARARQIVVIGDPGAPEGTAAATAAAALPVVDLATAPSARDPYLTSFLVAHGYGTPSPVSRLGHAEPLVSFTVVDGTALPEPDTGVVQSNSAEVEAVTAMVVDHALRSGSPLAVIAGTPLHAARIREAIEAEVRRSPALADFFAPDAPEPFVVTDVTRTAGLRCQNVIFSLGIGKTPHGRVLHRFGALSDPGGDYRLLAALAAPTHWLHVVTSITAQDLDEDRLRTPGAQLLAEFLTFAQLRAKGATIAMGAEPSEPPLLLADLARRLRDRGLHVELAFGITGGPRIPLVVGPGDGSGDLLVAVLADDEAYAKTASVRTRDRLNAANLERLGWSVVQVFTTALFAEPEAQAERVAQLVAHVAARRAARAMQVAQVAPQVVAVEDDDQVDAPNRPGRRLPSGEGESAGAEAPETSESAGGPAPEPAVEPVVPGPVASESADSVESAESAASAGDTDADETSAPDTSSETDDEDHKQDTSSDAEPVEDVAPQPEPEDTEEPAASSFGVRRPDLRPGQAITSYSSSDIDKLARWLLADGTDWDEKRLVKHLREELGVRRGARTDAILRASVRRVL